MRGKLELCDSDNVMLDSYVDVDDRGVISLSIGDHTYGLSTDSIAVLDKAIGDSINKRVKIMESRGR